MLPEVWQRLPEQADLAALEQAARVAYGAGREVVAAPGTQALLQWLPRLVPARRVGILGFTYAEHETCWRAAGAGVEVVEALDDLAAFDVAVVVNPNNPDGRLVGREPLAALAGQMAAREGLLIVDEAFMDVMPAAFSLVRVLPASGALVLRSFGKVYGLAGVRLGFAVAPLCLADRLRAAMGPWAVSGPAIALGRRALADTAWLAATMERLGREADRLDGLLLDAGFRLVGGTRLFRLAEHPDAARWFERLARAGVLVRPFGARPAWLRFGIPGDEHSWGRVGAVLRS